MDLRSCFFNNMKGKDWGDFGKRLAALLLACVMTFTSVPLTAFAEGEDTDSGVLVEITQDGVSVQPEIIVISEEPDNAEPIESQLTAEENASTPENQPAEDSLESFDEPAEKVEIPENVQEPAEEAENPEDSQEPAEEAENPEDVQEPAEEAENPEDVQEPAEEAENPEDAQEPAEEAENPEDAQEPAEEAENPEDAQEPAEEAENPEDPQEPAGEEEEDAQEPNEEDVAPEESEEEPGDEAEDAEDAETPDDEGEEAQPEEENPSEEAKEDEENNTPEEEEKEASEDEDGDTEGEEESQEIQFVDITQDRERLTLKLADWWYESWENLLQISDNHYANYAVYEPDPENAAPAGVSLQFTANQVKAGEYFTVRLPMEMWDAAFDRPALAYGVECVLIPVDDYTDEDYGCTDLRVTFTEDMETVTGTLFLRFTMGSSWNPFSLLLQGEEDTPEAEAERYWVFTPIPVLSVVPFAETDDAPEDTSWQKKATISVASIAYNSQIGDFDQDDALKLKPKEFSDQKLNLTAFDEDGNIIESLKNHVIQQSVSGEPYYLKFVHDGEGGGSFEILNVPNYFVNEKGETVKIAYYKLSVDTKDFPAYDCTPIQIDMFDAEKNPVTEITMDAEHPMQLNLAYTGTITLAPKMNDDKQQEVEYTILFSDSETQDENARTIKKVYTVTAGGEPAVIQVPVGMYYTVTQSAVDGYRLGSYTVQEGEDGTPVTVDAVTGKFELESDNVTVSSMNYSQNLEKEFTVTWLDDGVLSSRPEVSSDLFVLQYQVETVNEEGEKVLGEWVTLTDSEDDLKALGLSKYPDFAESTITAGKYAFLGIPSTDKDGNPVSFRVQLKDDEISLGKKKYTTAVAGDEENPTGFVFSETMTFTATINWNDANSPESRPAFEDINKPDGMQITLSYWENGELNTVELPEKWIKQEGDSWKISVSDLPRYDANGNEYDYILQAMTPADYKAYYTNPQGNYSSDTENCHNGGSILEKINKPTNFGDNVEYTPFRAVKQWNDDWNNREDDVSEEKKVRGTPTVTLWRYSMKNSSDTDIDAAFTENRAAPVVYHHLNPAQTGEGGVIIPESYTDIVLSYQLNGAEAQPDGTQTIVFDENTVDGLPDGYRLPGYDEQGRPYVYFIRETTDTENYAQNYTGDFKNGAVYDGVISNTRREKAAVNVTVEWKAPANLADLNPGTSVEVKIVDKDGNELTVYSPAIGSYVTQDEVQTIDGFNENIALLDLSFYVNIYGPDGKAIDMSKAVIKEVNILPKGQEPIPVMYQDEDGNETAEGHFTLQGDEFKTNSTYVQNPEKENPSDGGMKEFSYKVTNTITGKRDYNLVKKWDDALVTHEEYKNIAAVYFKLTRTSSNAAASETETVTITVGNHDAYAAPSPRVNNPHPGDTQQADSQGYLSWETVLRDLPKYDENGYVYLYKAQEVYLYTLNGEQLVPSEISVDGRIMSVYHTWTEDQTTALNYIPSPGAPHIWIFKNWVDNGDAAAHGTAFLRFYRKSDVLDAFGWTTDNEITDTTLISLDNLGCEFYPFTLSSGNNWTRDISTRTIEEEIRRRERGEEKTTSLTPEEIKELKVQDYFVVEYKATYADEAINPIPTTSTAAQFSKADLWKLAALEKYSATGSLSNSNRQYQTTSAVHPDNNSYVDITNTRVGQVSLQINKFWHDDGKNRPDVTFTIYRDGEPLKLEGAAENPASVPAGGGELYTIKPDQLTTYISANGAITVKTSDEPTQQESNDESTSDSEQLPVAQDDPETEEPADAKKPSTMVLLKDLPMFSEHGVPYTYNVVEGVVSSYISEKGTTVATPRLDGKPDNTQYTYSYTNTKTGTTVHVAYKMWNDIATKGDDRPDVAFTLYQYLLANENDPTQWKKYEAKDPILIPLKNADKGTDDSTSEDSGENASADAEQTEPDNAEQDSSDNSGQNAPNSNGQDTSNNDPNGDGQDTSNNDPDDNGQGLPNGEGAVPSYQAPANEADYDLKVITSGLPAYDENGQEYGYRFVEKMNSKSNGYAGYQSTYGRFNDQVDIYTNTLVGTTTFGGDKLWANLEKYQIDMENDLPSPTMLLYRSTEPFRENMDKADALTGLTPILTTSLNDAKDGYSFPGSMTEDELNSAINSGYIVMLEDEDGNPVPKKDADGNPIRKTDADGEPVVDENGNPVYVSDYALPKFDQNGARYYYTVWETLASGDDDEQGKIADLLYHKLSSSGTMTNTFRDNYNRRQIEVTKLWSGRDTLDAAHDVYPTVTYTLYRYLESGRDAAAEKGHAEYPYVPQTETGSDDFVKKIATQSIAPAVFKDAAKPNSAVFTDLLIYSPKGEAYQYFVVEDPIPGYTQTYTDEEQGNTKTDYSDVTTTPELKEYKLNGQEDPKSNVSTDNDYDKPGSINIQGSKKWNDYDNDDAMSGTRPKRITLTLRRSTKGADPVQTKNQLLTLVETEEEANPSEYKYWIEWTRKEQTGDWEYTIHNLERIAPNGEYYTYVVSEVVNETTIAETGYTTSYGSNTFTVKPNSPDTLTCDDVKPIENKFSGSYTVRKDWLDGNNAYGLRPSSIQVALQRRAAGSDADWENIAWDAAYTGLNPVTVGGAQVVGYTLTKTDVIANTKGNSWRYTFSNLPKYRMVLNADDEWVRQQLEYRAIETRIGTEAMESISVKDEQGVTISTTDASVHGKAASYEYTLKSRTDTLSTVQNLLVSTKLLVTKKWTDQNNKYFSRPASLEFTLQMSGYEVMADGSVNELNNWRTVQVNGQDYFVLSAENGWKVLLEDLPTAFQERDENGEPVGTYYAAQFRAVERSTKDRIAGEGTYPIYGAENYIDKTSYALHSQNHVRDDKQSSSTIENLLLILGDITVEKTWRRDTDSEKAEAVFQLQYRQKSKEGEPEKEWETYFIDKTKKDAQREIKESIYTDSAVMSYTWNDLPKYDLGGNALEYRVVEHAVDGYVTIATQSGKEVEKTKVGDTDATYVQPERTPKTNEDGEVIDTYRFTNIELQDYTVKKTWINTDYASRAEDGSFTAVFVLEQKIPGEDWEPVMLPAAADAENPSEETTLIPATVTLRTDEANGSESYTWYDLPKYTPDGKAITYRARETHINGDELAEGSDTNGSYIVSYEYDEGKTDAHGFITEATNRMVYGFVNLQKTRAYLNPDVTALLTDEGEEPQIAPMPGVTFDIYSVNDEGNLTKYVTGVETDENGFLQHSDGKYGVEKTENGVSYFPKYLIAGKYKLVETGTDADYSLWEDGITFTVGVTGEVTEEGTRTQDTGEHGTAWISTSGENALTLNVSYLHQGTHSEDCMDTCEPDSADTVAYNLESRGILQFTKKGWDGANLNTHSGSDGAESKAWFGVYWYDKTLTKADDNCTENYLVAYMAADTEDTLMELTTDRPDSSFPEVVPGEKTNSAGLPYLRQTSDEAKTLSLLSGFYYVKELVAPAGYILDETPRKAEVLHRENNQGMPYSSNIGSFVPGGERVWPNKENQVQLYKLDQFGRHVDLSGEYLELQVVTPEGSAADNVFLTGSDTIYLYQNADAPASPAQPGENGEIAAFDEGNEPNITYSIDAKGRGYWIFTGLFDAGKTYTISEPSAPDNYIQAESFTFKMEKDGTISVISGATAEDKKTAKDDVLEARGDDFDNYYYPTNKKNEINQVVLRDPARFRTNVILEKVEVGKVPKKTIPNIAFQLFSSEDKRPILPDKVYLVTDENGQIDLSEAIYVKETDKGFTTQVAYKDKINRLTGCDLKYGLDIGRYYFQEVEYGASDIYKLVTQNIQFSIDPNVLGEDDETPADFEDYAKVTYVTSEDGPVTQGEEENYGVVSNTPVDSTILLNLTKVEAKENPEENIPLPGAEFKLVYKSINHNQSGAQTDDDDETEEEATIVYECVTGEDGVLYLDKRDAETGELTGELPDISKKGTYTLTETKAPESYMTRTEDGKFTPIPLLTFSVTSANEIDRDSVQKTEGTEQKIGTADLVSYEIKKDELHISLDVTADNEKTIVSVAKLNDLVKSKKTCNQKDLNGEPLNGATLQILQGETEVAKWKTDDTEDNSYGEVIGNVIHLNPGLLKENTIYTLHELEPPVGFMAADDIYFYIFGTTKKGDAIISQIYVWDGENVPSATTETGWVKNRNLDGDKNLTMVDEAIIAPVNLQKVLQMGESSAEALKGVIFDVKVGENLYGTAETNEYGYLLWKTITTKGYQSKLIYNADGAIVTSGGTNTPIILRENDTDYTFTESYAPDNAYNDGRSYHVAVTANNYVEYKTTSDGKQYDDTKYINIVEADGNETDYTVEELSVRVDEKNRDSLDGLAVNLPYRSTVTLHKYDADEEAQSIAENGTIIHTAIAGAEFTLYRCTVENGKEVQKPYKNAVSDQQKNGAPSVFVTDSTGDLSITIPEKGTYILKETNAAAGYDEESPEFEAASFRFTLEDRDEHQPYRQNGTAILTAENDTAGVPNIRLMGGVTLEKKDANTGVAVDGTVFTLTRTTPDDISSTNFVINQPVKVTVGKQYEAQWNEDNEVWELIESDGESGKIIITGLNWAAYTLQEDTEQEGYIHESVPPVYRFEVTATQLNPTLHDNGSNEVTNTKNHLKLVKNSVDGEPLKGAEFQLYYVTENNNVLYKGSSQVLFYQRTVTDTGTVDAMHTDGIVKFGNASEISIYGLNKATYLLHETKAPDGYELAGYILFDMDRDGTIKNVKSCTVDGNVITTTDDYPYVETAGAGTKDALSVLTVKDNPIEVSLTKYLSDLKVGGDGENGIPSAREQAEYSITGVFAEEGAAEKTLTFQGNAIQEALKAKLIGGNTYTLTETKAPLGYEVRESVQITVAEDGEVTLVGNETYLACDNNDPNGVAKLTLTDDPIEMALEKLDTSGDPIDQKTLGYAEFTIFGRMVVEEDGKEIAKDTSITEVTELNARQKTHGHLIAGETYTVTETKAPAGYLLTPEFRIKIDKDGTIKTVESELADKNGDTLKVTDKPTVVQFNKVDDNGSLADAQFKLTPKKMTDGSALPNSAFVNFGEDGTGSLTGAAIGYSIAANEISWTSTKEPVVLTNLLITGVVYRLDEVNRVPNHEVMDGPILFHVETNGTVVLEQDGIPSIPNNSSVVAAEVGADNITMTIRNPIIRGSVKLTKYWREEEDDDLDTTKTLPGATYKLTRIENEFKESTTEEITANDEFVYAYDGKGSINSFTTDSKGEITITGLPEGKYQFEEIDAPKAYHINFGETIPFEIHEADQAIAVWESETNPGTAIDTRINASISIEKYSSDDSAVEEFRFDVRYSETKDGKYVSIGQISDTAKKLEKANYSQIDGKTLADEGLRRGFYELEELSGKDQMLNDNEFQKRNILRFEIVNDIGKEYAINTDLAAYLKDQKNHVDGNASHLLGIEIPNPGFIHLSEAGIVDTRIPTKTVTVTKIWEDDDDLDLTFRPDSVTIQLYRAYNEGDPVAVGEPLVLNARNDWSGEWTDLEAYVNADPENEGKDTTYLYTYSVEEVEDEGNGYWKWYEGDPQLEPDREKTTAVYRLYNGELDGDSDATVTNTIAKKQLSISKTLGGGSQEDEFQVRVILTYEDGSPAGKDEHGYFLDEYSLAGSDEKREPDEDGWATIKGNETLTISLPEGINYEVQERQAEDGTENAWSSGSEGKDSQYHYVTRYLNDREGKLDKDATVSIRNAARKSIKLTKLDADSENTTLTGAEFTVVYTLADGTEDTRWEKCTINEDGVLVDESEMAIDITRQGVYTIQETMAPVGYIRPTNQSGDPTLLLTLTVGTDDQLTAEINNSILVSAKQGDNVIADDGTTADAIVKNQKISLTIAKVDEVSGERISGVTFQLERDDGTLLAGYDGITNSDGQWTTVEIDGVVPTVTFISNGKEFIPGSKYVLKEISGPDTYNVLTDEFSFAFEIDEFGSLKHEDSERFYTWFNPADGETKDGETKLTPTGIHLLVKNPANTDLKLIKQSPTLERLGGVEFRLEVVTDSGAYPAALSGDNGTYKAAVHDHQVVEGTANTVRTANSSDDNKGIALIQNLPDGTYRLTETKTVAGYNLLSDPIIITIDRVKGKFTWRSGSKKAKLENALDGNELTVTVINQKGLTLPATGTVTPQLPKAILGITAFLEGLVLFLYQRSTKRKRREAEF